MNFIKQQIESYDTIIIHGHKNPDGDCYGSQIGLKEIILTTFPKKKVFIVGEINKKLSFLGKMDQIDDQVYQNALVFIVDCGQSNVISDNRYNLGKKIIRIDHHLLIENIGDYQWVDSSFSSCSQMIYFLKEKNNFKLNPKGALAIYVGIVSDTGNFRFERVDSQTLKVASNLLNYNLNVFEIDQKINSKNVQVLKFQGYVLNNFIAEEGLIYIKISEEIRNKFNLKIEDVVSGTNILSNTENYPIWMFIVEINNHWKLSIRTSGPRIDHIVNQFGGGGHFRACGVIVKTIEEVEKIINLLKESFKTFQQQKKISTNHK
ncbi:DHHA1 domain protein [Candidatus Phytoplasma oryzae]|uniref:DHHA1 domain protein n=1 Tax=Candidatus Phytoplasma oryzae TaxID=203274 RepID=A0A139JQQ7_9MOLU|nr:bifunctional oligoribonuclease/PAP phosphatase NrnA [Candidatus Phytoplasma oryzae]KXT29299.1 DHHA1 domain protein [Candidatus Phytoplasma oryzae]RAM57570.1 exopolyphosphatase [Candidatus Phytoplasma oryzae]